MSKRTTAKLPADLKKKEEQAEQLPRNINRIIRLTLELALLIAIPVFCILVWDGTIVMTPKMQGGSYGFLIALGLCIIIAITWRWLHRKVVFGRYSVEGLLTLREQELRAHEAALREARAESEQAGRQAAEKKLAGEIREATQLAERAQRQVAALSPKAKRWDEEGAAAELARRELATLTDAAQRASAESAAALVRSREAEQLAVQLLGTERHRRRRRVERMLRLRGRVVRVTAQNSQLRSELQVAKQQLQNGQDAVEHATAALRATLAVREQSIAELQATEAVLRREVETAHGSAAEAWNQIGEHQRLARAAKDLMLRAIQAIEQILQTKKRERFLPMDKSLHQMVERFNALVKELAVAVKRLLREEREDVLDRQKEVREQLEATVKELGVAKRDLERERRLLLTKLAASDAALLGFQQTVSNLERERTILSAQLEAAATRSTSTLPVLNAMERLSGIWTTDLEAPIQALRALGLVYDLESGQWRGESLPAAEQALILMGRTGAQQVACYLQTADAAAAALDIDEADDEQAASMERAEFLGESVREFVAGAVSRYSAVDWLLALPPAERKALVNARQVSDWFVMLVIAGYLAGRRKCRFILETDAYYQVRDKLSPMIVACIGSTLRAEQHRSVRAIERITQLRISTMFYSEAILRGVKKAATLVSAHGTCGGVSGDPHSWALWLSVVANPPDVETATLFSAARRSLMALWCLSPTELRELLIDAIGGGSHDAIRATHTDGRKSIAAAAAAMMGFDPTFALAFSPTSQAEWSAVGSRASIYSLIELISLSHPSRGIGGSLGGKKVNRAFDPFQAVALEWMYAHNNDPGGKLSPHMRSHTLRLPEVNAKRVGDLGSQFFSTFVAARKECERAMAV